MVTSTHAQMSSNGIAYTPMKSFHRFLTEFLPTLCYIKHIDFIFCMFVLVPRPNCCVGIASPIFSSCAKQRLGARLILSDVKLLIVLQYVTTSSGITIQMHAKLIFICYTYNFHKALT